MKLKEKILIRAYVNGNFGDDLFVHILCNRYPEQQFLLIGEKRCRHFFSHNHNLQYKCGDTLIYKIMNGIYVSVQKMTGKYIGNNRNIFLYNFFCQHVRENVYITGSFFAQDPYYRGMLDQKWYDSHPIIMGCNFGPYTTEQFYQDHLQAFQKTKFISFRDQYSFSLFKGLEQARIYPDIVFNLNPKPVSMKGYYLISVVNLHKDEYLNTDKIYDDYVSFMQKAIREFLKKGKRVVMTSFCTEQGDGRMIEEILQGIKESDNIEIADYDSTGIENMLELYAGADAIVATRFHAMILGLIFAKKILPISYNEKMFHTLMDAGYTGRILNLSDLASFDCMDIESQMSLLDYDKLRQMRAEAEGHFIFLDHVLGHQEKVSSRGDK